MVNWLVIVAFILILLWFFKFRNMKHKFYAVFIVLLLIFFYTSFSNVVSKNNINVASFDGVVNAGKLYFIWLGNALQNIATLSGNAIKMEWGTNSTG